MVESTKSNVGRINQGFDKVGVLEVCNNKNDNENETSEQDINKDYDFDEKGNLNFIQKIYYDSALDEMARSGEICHGMGFMGLILVILGVITLLNSYDQSLLPYG